MARMTNKITSLAKLACILALLDGADARIAQADERTAMELEAKIALGDVRGRIDHMAVDLARQRVFFAGSAMTASASSTLRHGSLSVLSA